MRCPPPLVGGGHLACALGARPLSGATHIENFIEMHEHQSLIPSPQMVMSMYAEPHSSVFNFVFSKLSIDIPKLRRANGECLGAEHR